MANYCKYNVRIKGSELACSAFVRMMPVLDWAEVTNVETEDNLTVFTFEGYCKWSLHHYTRRHTNICKLSDAQLQKIVDGYDETDYWEYHIDEKSLLCDTEVWSCSADIEDFHGVDEEHYRSGKDVWNNSRDERILEELSYSIKKEVLDEISRVKFVDGKSYVYKGIHKPGTIVMVEGSKAGIIGMVTGNEFTERHDLASITKILGFIDPPHDGDLEILWDELDSEAHKNLISAIGKSTNNKNTFISGASSLWITKGYEEKADWENFLVYLGKLSGKNDFVLSEELKDRIAERRIKKEPEQEKKIEERRRESEKRRTDDDILFGKSEIIIADTKRETVVLKNNKNIEELSDLFHIKKKVFFIEQEEGNMHVYIFDQEAKPHEIGTLEVDRAERTYGKIGYVNYKNGRPEVGIELYEYKENEPADEIDAIKEYFNEFCRLEKEAKEREREKKELENLEKWKEKNELQQIEKQQKQIEKLKEKEEKKEQQKILRDEYNNRTVERIPIDDPKIQAKLERLFDRLEVYYPEHAVFALDAISGRIREDSSSLAKTIGYKNYNDMFRAYGWKVLKGEEVKEIRNEVIYTPGNEPDFMKARVNNTIENLGKYYPSHLIKGSIQNEHSNIASTLSGLYQWFGYDSIADFLSAYGFDYKPKSSGGRPATFNPQEILSKIKERMNGEPYRSMSDLLKRNEDISGKIKTLSNNAIEVLGMPLGKYFKINGIIKKGDK